MSNYRLKFILFEHDKIVIFIIFEQSPLFTVGQNGVTFYEFRIGDFTIASSMFIDIEYRRLYIKGLGDDPLLLASRYHHTSVIFQRSITETISHLISWSKNAKEFQSLPYFEPYIQEIPEEVKEFIFGFVDKSNYAFSKFSDDEIAMLGTYASYV